MSQAIDPPIAEHIAAVIAERISRGELKSGDRIIEQAVADEFGTSRGPVRDALRFLHARNWIQLLPHQGARVATPGSSPSSETILMAAVMFGLACRFASLKATEDELTILTDKIRTVVRRSKAKNPDRLLQATRDAGYFIIGIVRNPQIDDTIGPIPRMNLGTLASQGLTSASDIKEAIDYWVRLATAIRVRQPDEAERLGRALIEASYRRIVVSELTDEP